MSTDKRTFTQIREQLAKTTEATVLVERSNGQITTGTYKSATPARDNTHDIAVDNGESYKPVHVDVLTDENQAELAGRLAEDKPLKAEMGNAAVSTVLGTPPGLIDHTPDHIANLGSIDAPAEVPVSPQERADTLSTAIDSLLGELSTDDKDTLFRYSLYASDKEDAQYRNDGHGSELAGQYQGQEYRSLSPKAQQVANRYHGLMQQLSRVRRQQ